MCANFVVANFQLMYFFILSSEVNADEKVTNVLCAVYGTTLLSV